MRCNCRTVYGPKIVFTIRTDREAGFKTISVCLWKTGRLWDGSRLTGGGRTRRLDYSFKIFINFFESQIEDFDSKKWRNNLSRIEIQQRTNELPLPWEYCDSYLVPGFCSILGKPGIF